MPKLEMITDGHLGGYIHGGDPGTWCPNLWSWVVREYQIRSVLDVGCGEGHSTRFFKGLGCDVTGVDGCQQAIDDSVIPECVSRHDFCTGPFAPDEPCDLIWSCEFLEHVEARYLPHILATFAQARRFLLITHAFPGQDDGHHHVNCQPSSYWIRHIESVGFVCDAALTRQARTVTLKDYAGVNHFARSGLVFRRLPAAPQRQVPGLLSRCGTLLSATYRAWAIHRGFRWSGPFREHVRLRRAAKRAARRQRDGLVG